jgi:hypothetical protein
VRLKTQLDTLDALDVDSIVVFLAKQDGQPLSGIASFLDWRLCGRLSSLLQAAEINCAHFQCTLIASEGRIRPERIFIFGAGKNETGPDTIGALLTFMADTLILAKTASCAVAAPDGNLAFIAALERLTRTVSPLHIHGIFEPDPFIVQKA